MTQRVLPTHPNLEQYRKQAKDLVTDRAQASPEAFTRIRHSHPRLRDLSDVDLRSAAFKLSDAQFIIAREHAFDSWPKFASHVQTLQSETIRATQGVAQPEKWSERIAVDGVKLSVEITIPPEARGLVLFTNASGSSRFNPRNRATAELLNRGALATIQTDLLTEDEELADLETEALSFELRLLGRRIAAITDWLGDHPRLKGLGLGYLGSGTGASAALFAAAERPSFVRAVVSSGGRPDLSGPFLWKVKAPTLLIVGGKDALAVGLHRSAITWFQQNERRLEVIDGVTQRFEGSDAFEKCSVAATKWFQQHLAVSL